MLNDMKNSLTMDAYGHLSQLVEGQLVTLSHLKIQPVETGMEVQMALYALQTTCSTKGDPKHTSQPALQAPLSAW